MEKNTFCVLQKNSSAEIDGWQEMENAIGWKRNWSGKSSNLILVYHFLDVNNHFFHFSGLQLAICNMRNLQIRCVGRIILETLKQIILILKSLNMRKLYTANDELRKIIISWSGIKDQFP